MDAVSAKLGAGKSRHLDFSGTALDESTLNPLTVRMAYVRDAASARAEFGGQFRDDVETFISLEQLESRIVEGAGSCRTLEHDLCRICGSSGGCADSFVLAIAHLETGKAVLDVIAKFKRVRPEAAVELSGICKGYKITN